MGAYVLLEAWVAGNVLFYDGPLYASTNLDGVNYSTSPRNFGPGMWGVLFGDMDLEQRAMLVLIQLAAAIPVLLIFWNLRQLFVLYSRGIVFARENIALIRMIAWLLIAYPLAHSAGEVVLQLAAGSDINHFGLGGNSLWVGIGVLFIAHVMDLGRELQNEQEQFL
jgi:hypothetical protein